MIFRYKKAAGAQSESCRYRLLPYRWKRTSADGATAVIWRDGGESETVDGALQDILHGALLVDSVVVPAAVAVEDNCADGGVVVDGVGSRAAVDRVLRQGTGVGIDDERVVAGHATQDVGAVAAIHRVVVAATDQRVVAVAAVEAAVAEVDDRVVAVTTVDAVPRRIAEAVVGGGAVIALFAIYVHGAVCVGHEHVAVIAAEEISRIVVLRRADGVVDNLVGAAFTANGSTAAAIDVGGQVVGFGSPRDVDEVIVGETDARDHDLVLAAQGVDDDAVEHTFEGEGDVAARDTQGVIAVLAFDRDQDEVVCRRRPGDLRVAVLVVVPVVLHADRDGCSSRWHSGNDRRHEDAGFAGLKEGLRLPGAHLTGLGPDAECTEKTRSDGALHGTDPYVLGRPLLATQR